MLNASTIIELGGKGLLLTAAAFVLTLLLRRRSASHRHAVCLLAVLGLLVLPVATWRAPQVRVQVPEDSRFASFAERFEPEIPAPITPAVSTGYEPNSLPEETPQDWVFALYASVSGLLLLPLTVRNLLAASVIRRANPVTIDGHRVRVTDRLTVPATAGFFRPVVLVPVGFETWPAERREMALAHELAHIHRKDWAWDLLAQLACAIHWFNPFTWLLAARMRSESELACDDWVLAQGHNAEHYAQELLQIAKQARFQFAAVLCMAHRPNVKDRLLAIIDSRRRRGAVQKRFVAAGLIVSAAIAVFIGAIKPAIAQQTPIPDHPAVQALVRNDKPGWHGPLKVLVLDEQGRPVPDAQVMFQLGMPNVAGCVVPPDGHTGKKGAYTATEASFAEDEKRPFSDTRFMSIEAVVAYKPGLQPEVVFVKTGQKTAKIILGKRGLSVKAKVMTTSGEPAEGAEVSVRNFVPTNDRQTTIGIRPRWRQFFTAKVDATGYATFHDCPQDYKLEVDTWDPRYCRQPWYGAKRVVKGELEKPVYLTRAATLRGTVTENRRPVGNLMVQASHETQDPSIQSCVATTDAKGAFVITGAYPGDYTVQVIADEGRKLRRGASLALQNIRVEEGSTVTGLNLKITRGAVITGRVTYLDGSVPKSTFQIGCDRPEGATGVSLNGYASTDANGNYRLTIPSGRHTLYVISIPDPEIAPSKQVAVRDGDELKVNFVIPRTW